MNVSNEERIQKDIDYAFGIFNHYLGVFPRDKVTGANVCELGPGNNLGISLLFKCLGANQVHVVDKYLKPWDAENHPAFYRELAQRCLDKFPDANVDPLLKTAEQGHEAAPLNIWKDDAEILSGIPDSSLDFCGSWAVLEHLYEPERAFARIGEVTRRGGIGLHQVDFRDHMDFSRPLEFLLYEFRWNKMPDRETMIWLAERLHDDRKMFADKDWAQNLIRRTCGWYGNSYRHLEYNSLWQKNGFKILNFEANLFAEDAYLDDFIPRLRKSGAPAQSLGKEELKVVSGLYFVKKL